MTGKRIAQLVQMACIREVCAPKPGNVSRYHDFSDTTFEDFLLSAIAIGAAFEHVAEFGVGKTILDAMKLTRQLVASNTNLGMILLLVPLAKAAMACVHSGGGIRQQLSSILKCLTVEDARLAYEAIRLAQPANLGRVNHADISEEPSITLLEAMALAKDRDAVAREYATEYAITFEIGLPALKKALSKNDCFSKAVVQAFLTILSRVPDTLILRKSGIETAAQVSQKAQEVLNRGGAFSPEGRMGLEEMHQALSDPAHSMNPGTSADLTAAAIFLHLMEREAGIEQ